MIAVDRNRVPEPEVFRSAAAEKARQAAARFFRLTRKERRQRRFQVSDFVTGPEVARALVTLFHGKCAYCETPIFSPGPANICHYRPAEGAIGSDGRFASDHYWWTAYEWDNLHLACTECMRLKGHRFPVEGPRRGPGNVGKEKALLLDPCREEPLQHLLFNRRGKVVSETRRGRATIEILGLNRVALDRKSVV
jgi:5-methylcytosine-specific restriction endonuclease McrA